MVLARPEPDTRPIAATAHGPVVAEGARPARVRRGGTITGHTAVLSALCVGLVMTETLLLLHLRAGSALALAPQIAAPPPWGVFHDDRWLLVGAGSWTAVGAGALALIAGRGVLTAVMVKLAWPASARPLPWRTALLRGCSSTAVAAVLLSPCASLLVAFELAPISDLWLAAVPTALGIAIFVHHGPVECWWLRHPRLRSIGWMFLSYLELTVAGAVMVSVPRAWTPFVAVAAGLADAVTWRGLVRALARPAVLKFAPVGVLGIGAVAAITVVAVTAATTPAISASTPPRSEASAASGATNGATSALTGRQAPAAERPATDRAVLVVSGYGVRWSGNPANLGTGFDTTEFSYRGLDKRGRPLPYGSSATQAPLPILVDRFRTQVDALARKAGTHIDIVGESEGSLLATIYLLTTPNPPVDHVVLLSPLVRPAGASYPARGHDGAGLAAAWELRGIAAATNYLTPMHVSPDSAFINSLGSHAEALRQAFGCPVGGVHQFAILPLADAVGIPRGALSDVPHETVPALHGTLLVDPHVRFDIARYLASSSTSGGRGNALAMLASAAGAAWQAPPRHLAADPPTAAGCQQATAALRAWLS